MEWGNNEEEKWGGMKKRVEGGLKKLAELINFEFVIVDDFGSALGRWEGYQISRYNWCGDFAEKVQIFGLVDFF